VIALGVVCLPVFGTEVGASPACVGLLGGRLLETTVELYGFAVLCRLIERYFDPG
jgi:hypothetical protein